MLNICWWTFICTGYLFGPCENSLGWAQLPYLLCQMLPRVLFTWIMIWSRWIVVVLDMWEETLWVSHYFDFSLSIHSIQWMLSSLSTLSSSPMSPPAIDLWLSWFPWVIDRWLSWWKQLLRLLGCFRDLGFGVWEILREIVLCGSRSDVKELLGVGICGVRWITCGFNGAPLDLGFWWIDLYY